MNSGFDTRTTLNKQLPDAYRSPVKLVADQGLGAHVSHQSELAIEADGLVKTFGDNRAVDGVSLAIPRGTVYGVLGPNGAGKTTTIRMLATLLRPNGGFAKVGGFDVATEADKVRSVMTLAGQFASVDEDLTGTENLVLLARLYGFSRKGSKDRSAQLLEAFGLTAAADRQVKNYSGGMRRRIDIAASLVVVPEIVFLDEPTTGLDPRSRNQVWDIVRALVSDGATVLLTTQYLEEADQLARRIAVIDTGRVIAEGTPGELKASVGTGVLHIRLAQQEQRVTAEHLLTSRLGVVVEPSSDPFQVAARISDPLLANRGISELHEANIELVSFSMGQPTLDEVFLALTGKDTEHSTAQSEASS